ncbi:MAG: hypothetical protein A2504_07460 [Bdellovibrionales bacterium RIFOXYD12_FULL_39_22]|nr:MAG: hypothetical protein A2385_16830 [Bdellovibrionales bacterium RIFOXYB1_FULL_39_21]OFZ44714.1 MAG: hypothetical protein A2485_14690 [Bdellovibrionales bacterium RIFOXYC12_FULL_39_17]OFZ49344.1 MAG: hypothetical protein A2404_08985 [Bdellovibrionales bacterium RIFOXYC1_FULL_39_130]OFZ77080.1 MAG: hypothetical protein A2560_09950 [Bdellovibrionales bacterium RIFOXYD1_FULL_39_84]OFZ95340.1 MAG: hypothetical protein A2504_07460 [Bdellovibrionales bacterium RIFOXYD12_FULL_39_22]HLE13042.1 hy
MKKYLFAFLMAIFIGIIPFTVFAFSPESYCSINRLDVTCSIYNPWDRPIICSGRADAITARGWQAFVFMYNQVLYPGTYRYMYLYSNYYDPFVRARARLDCNWWYW